MKRFALVTALLLAPGICQAIPEDTRDYRTLTRTTILPAGSRVESVAFSPDQKWLAAGANSHILLWDEKLNNVQPLQLHDNLQSAIENQQDDPVQTSGTDDSRVRKIAFSPDSKKLLAGCPDGTLRQWDLSTRRESIFADPSLSSKNTPILSHAGRIRAISYSHDGKYIATGGDDKAVRLWDASEQKMLYRWGGLSHPVVAVAFSDDDMTVTAIAAAGTDDRAEFKRWNTENGEMEQESTVVGFSENAAALSPDARMAVSRRKVTGLLSAMSFWNTRTGELIRPRGLKEAKEFKSGAGAVVFSHYGGVVAVAGSAHADPARLRATTIGLRIWDTETGVLRSVLNGTIGNGQDSPKIRGLAMTRDARSFAFACNNSTVEIWSTR